jgi:hypothetical protein
MSVDTLTTTKRSLRVVEAFYAPQVEGPIRLFDEQQLLLAYPPPLVMAAGSTPTLEARLLVTTTGSDFAVRAFPEAAGWFAIGRLSGYVALAGAVPDQSLGVTAKLWRNCDTTFSTWEVVFDFGDFVSPTSDIEHNPDTGRTLICTGDLSGGPMRLWKTDDDGDTVVQVPIPANFTGAFRSLKYNRLTKTWFAAGGRTPVAGSRYTLRSFDDGDTWEALPGVPAGDRFYDLEVNPLDGTVVLAPNANQPLRASFDNGETFVLGDTSAFARNLAVNPLTGRIIAERGITGGDSVMFSDDSGLTWTTVGPPNPFPFRHDISDLQYMDNVQNPGFLAVGRTDGSVVLGFAAVSPDGQTWELVYGPTLDAGFFIAATLTPSEYPRDFKMTLPVERYEQVQHWRMDNAEDPVAVAQLDRDLRFRGGGLVNSDLGLSTLLGAPQPAYDIAHTRERQSPDPIASPSHHWPRSRSVRIPGGYVSIHGEVGVVSRFYNYLGELSGQRCRRGV